MIPFTCLYWDFLRCVRIVEPKASEFGLSEAMAEVLRRQCQIEFKSVERGN